MEKIPAKILSYRNSITINFNDASRQRNQCFSCGKGFTLEYKELASPLIAPKICGSATNLLLKNH